MILSGCLVCLARKAMVSARIAGRLCVAMPMTNLVGLSMVISLKRGYRFEGQLPRLVFGKSLLSKSAEGSSFFQERSVVPQVPPRHAGTGSALLGMTKRKWFQRGKVGHLKGAPLSPFHNHFPFPVSLPRKG